MVRHVAVLILMLVVAPLQAAVVGKEVSYRSGDTDMKGYLAYDDAVTGKRPGILVVHEWWGHNAYARKRADMLAAMGYTALAVDMYGDGKTADHPEDAGKFATAVRGNLDTMQARFNAARDFLNSQETVDPHRCRPRWRGQLPWQPRGIAPGIRECHREGTGRQRR